MSTETLLEKMNLKQRLETLETDAQKTASDLNRQTDQLDGEPQKEGFAVLSFCHTSLWSSALRASSRPSSNRSSLTEEQLFELNVSAQKAAPGGTLTSLPRHPLGCRLFASLARPRFARQTSPKSRCHR